MTAERRPAHGAAFESSGCQAEPSLTTEEVTPLNAQQARSACDRVRHAVDSIADDLVRLYLGRAWLALGYQDWNALCRKEFGIRLDLGELAQAATVAELREAGLSVRAISTAVGVPRSTVADQLSGNRTVDGPVKITGLDGRERTVTPVRQPRPERAGVTARLAALDRAIDALARELGRGVPPEDLAEVDRRLPIMIDALRVLGGPS